MYLELIDQLKYIFYLLSILMCSALAYSCNIGPDFSDTPQITFIGISKDTMDQGSLFNDSIDLVITFRDGDGNLGTGVDGIRENIIIRDSRTGNQLTPFKIPNLPAEGAGAGIEGTITMKIYSQCCIFPDGTPACLAPPEFPFNELTYDIQMVDDGKDSSNVVTSTPVVLRCN